MKDYAIGIAIFLLLIVLLARGAIGQVKKVNEERQMLDVARSNLSSSMNNSAIKNKQLVVQFGNDDVAKFMRENGGTLQSMMEIGSINQRIGAESEALRIPIQEQKTDSRVMKGREGTVLTVVNMHQYSLAVLTTFRESLLWLGKVEDAFPYSRIENITFTPSGDYVNLQARILFPRMDPSVISH
jgi:hypothetical protein